MARAWPSDGIHLDAYDADAGAFYAKCGYREVARVSYSKTPLVYFELSLSAEVHANIARSIMSR